MKQKRMLIISLICILLLTPTLIGFWTFSRASALATYANQIAKVKETSTSLEMTLYGDPESARPVLELFQSLETGSIAWTGNIPEASPPPPEPVSGTITLTLDSLLFGKEPDGTWYGEVNDLNFNLDAGDIASAEVIADLVVVTVMFGESDGLPTLTINADLTGNVEVRLFFSILPLPGLKQALYEFVGEYFHISITIIKPVDISILSPSEEDIISGDVGIQANIITAPGIIVENVRWWADGQDRHYEGGMAYNESSGIAEGVWETWHGPDGDYSIRARADVRQENIQGYQYSATSPSVGVSVENPLIHITSWVWMKTNDGEQLLQIDNIPIQWWSPYGEGQFQTPFDLERWRDLKLEAQGGWQLPDNGGIQFERWVISDGDPNGGWVWEQGGTGIEINDWMLQMLYNRQLHCLYRIPEGS